MIIPFEHLTEEQLASVRYVVGKMGYPPADPVDRLLWAIMGNSLLRDRPK